MRSPRTADAPARVVEPAPAKVNLCLHVTGRRDDGYHLLDSIVAFADVGDLIEIELSDSAALTVTGPEAAGVPADEGNLVLKAARLIGVPATIVLRKELPNGAGIGGGSADAAATLRALSRLTGVPLPDGTERLGADVPVCLPATAARMRGIGERVEPLALPPLPAVLVNPRRALSTPLVFTALHRKDNPPLPDPLPPLLTVEDAIRFLSRQRNDLEPSARALEPEVDRVIAALESHPETRLARMSGSGTTCFALAETPEAAHRIALHVAGHHKGWWIRETRLG